MRVFSPRLVLSLPLAVFLVTACDAGGTGGNAGNGGSGNGGNGGSGGGMMLPDADGDTIADADEGTDDPDGDGIPNNLDDDSDGDGILDKDEAGDANTNTPPIDTDGDGTPDFLDDDSDGNGILDSQEGTADTDGDGKLDANDIDDDGDGINDVTEIAAAGSDCDGDGVIDPTGTPAAPADCDGDGIPNYKDTDSDGDTIADAVEGSFDTDQDGALDVWDLDSDNDTIPDSVEAGDADVATLPADSDGDMTPDYVDPDSDGDGLSDLLEIQNGSDPTNPDSDGDGTNDLIEAAAGTDPNNPADNPQANGDFVFVVPYQKPSDPLSDTLEFKTNIQFADVYFAFDISGSMLAELNAMSAPTGVPAIVDQIKCDVVGGACMLDTDCAAGAVCFSGGCITDPGAGQGCIPDVWTGVGTFTNLNTYHNILGLQPDPNATAAAVPTMTNALGAEAPFQPSLCIADPALCPNDAQLNCSGGGTVGCPGYRADAVRIYVQITDADDQCVGAECANFTAATAGAALQSSGIKFVSLYGTDDNTGAGTPQSVAQNIGIASNTLQINGQPYTYLAVDANVVPNAVTAILTLAKQQPLYATINDADDPADAFDATQFIEYLEVNLSGGNCNPVAPQGDEDSDGHKDSFPSLTPGKSVCWDLHPLQNQSLVMPTDQPQLFKATLTVYGDGSPLDTRDVYFLVPPKIDIIVPN